MRSSALFTPDGRLTAPLLLKEEIYAELECCAAKNIPRTNFQYRGDHEAGELIQRRFPPNPD